MSNREANPTPDFAKSFRTWLAQSRTALVDRWKQRVLDDPSVPRANRLSDPVLVDHIPALIDELIDKLEAAADESELDGPASGAGALGLLHGHQRARVRYSISEAMRELAHFRTELLALCREHNVLVRPREAELLHTTLDAMMTTSASELDTLRWSSISARWPSSPTSFAIR